MDGTLRQFPMALWTVRDYARGVLAEPTARR
jgi:hypothetical protein